MHLCTCRQVAENREESNQFELFVQVDELFGRSINLLLRLIKLQIADQVSFSLCVCVCMCSGYREAEYWIMTF